MAEPSHTAWHISMNKNETSDDDKEEGNPMDAVAPSLEKEITDNPGPITPTDNDAQTAGANDSVNDKKDGNHREMRSLRSLFEHCEWDDIVKVLEDRPPNEIKAELSGISGDLFDWACRSNAPHTVVRELLVIVQPLGSKFRFPLHRAIQKDYNFEVIKVVQKEYEDTLSDMELPIPGYPPLHLAIALNRSPEIIKFLLGRDPSVAKMKSLDGSLPLHVAIQHDCSLEIIVALLNEYPQGVKERDQDGLLPVQIAAERDSLKVVEALLKAYPESVEERDGDSKSPLRYAIENNCSLEAIETIIEANPNGVKASFEDDSLPLHVAAESKSSVEVIKALLKAHPEGARERNKAGSLPLYLAVENNSGVDVIETLIEAYPAGVLEQNRLEQKERRAYLPLQGALEKKCSLEVVQLLLKAESAEAANSTVNRSLRSSCLDIAVENNSSVEVIEALLDAYPNHTGKGDINSSSALHVAVKFNNSFGVVKALLKAYPEGVAEKDSMGALPLHDAIENNCSFDVCLALLQAYPEAAMEMRSKCGSLPLHLAIENDCSFEVIETLVEMYPEGVMQRNFYGLPLHIAACHSKRVEATKVIKLLVEAYPRGTKKKDNRHKVPLEIAIEKGCSLEVVTAIRMEESQDPSSLKDDLRVDLFQKVVLEEMDPKERISWLNKMSCKRKVVFFVMLELYLYIFWILSFVLAVTCHVYEDESNMRWAVFVLAMSVAFLSIKGRQLQKFKNDKVSYFLDFWNWIEVSGTTLAIVSAIKLLTEDPVSTGGITGTMRRLLMTTALFQLICFVSYLKKTLFPFAQFVGGMVRVFGVIVPFLLISIITLYAFAFMYFIQQYGKADLMEADEEEAAYATILESFRTVYTSFSGIEKTDSLLDYLFGLVIVIVLLNIVIAIVSKAWDEATESAQEEFWKYRLRFILEVTRGSDVDKWWFQSLNFFDQGDWVLKEESRGNFLEHVTRKMVGDLGWGLGLITFYWAFNLVFFLLGLVSFGLLWPLYIRQLLFCGPLPEEATTEKTEEVSETPTERTDLPIIDDLTAKINELSTENEKQKKQLDQLTSVMDETKNQLSKFEATIVKLLTEQLPPSR